MIVGLIVFEWKLERFVDAEAMTPATLVRMFDEHDAHQRWKENARRKG